MSASTLERIFARTSNLRTGRHRNKCSSKNQLQATIQECPGKEKEDGRPGVFQLDTVALCGGNLAESFYWILTLTDAQTQWFECSATWNHGAYNTKEAFQEIEQRLPIGAREVHPDNGSEFINKLIPS